MSQQMFWYPWYPLTVCCRLPAVPLLPLSVYCRPTVLLL